MPAPPDPRQLAAAGWTEDDLAWERLQEEGLAALAEERWEAAAAAWAEALAIAERAFPPGDARRAASLFNQASGLRRAGRAAEAAAMADAAIAAWDAAAAWVETLAPERRARSSLFHLRLERRHPGGYGEASRTRNRALLEEGRAIAAASGGSRSAAAALSAFRSRRPAGLNDTRKLLAAVLLMA
jgi:hypothetical protein